MMFTDLLCLNNLNYVKDKDQEQFTKQLLYYLGAFAGGIPVSTQIAAFSH